ncbi:MAG: glycosyltransferase family 9 protein [Actinomycetota bacterium]|nr:glycosyltransferase family 9 protein [Actinomycetota bacterium]
MSRPHVLLARLDSTGDVVLTGPAVRAVAASARQVTFLCGPRGRGAAQLLPGVDAVLTHRAAWIDPDPQPVRRDVELALVDRVAGLDVDEAVIFTSFHQSALPLALLLRFAGIETIAAISEDYPGSLLDVRHNIADDVHEVERHLSLVATLGYRLPPGDDGRLQVKRPAAGRPHPAGPPGYVVIHPGASVPARTWAPERHAALVEAVGALGWRVVVTGGPDEAALTARVTGGPGGAGVSPAGPRPGVLDLGGGTDLGTLIEVLADAALVVTGNTAPAHLAAAVGTAVVELYAPTVPSVRWRPWGVRHVLLGQQDIACAGCRATLCPVPGHPCLEGVAVGEVIDAIRSVLARRDLVLPPLVATGAGRATGPGGWGNHMGGDVS